VQLLLKKYKLYNARCALSFVAYHLKRENPSAKVYLPEYICESVVMAFSKNDLELVFYEVDFERKIALPCKGIKSGDLVVCVNYYGFELDYSQIVENNGVRTLYDSSHNCFIDINDCSSYDYVVVGFMKSLPFVTGGAYLYSKCPLEHKVIQRNSMKSLVDEIPNFLYDTFLYYLYNSTLFKTRKRYHQILSFPFEKMSKVLNEEVAQHHKMTITSKMTLWISHIFHDFYIKRYKRISLYFTGKSHVRTFFILKGEGVNSLPKDEIEVLSNWIDSLETDSRHSSKLLEYFQDTVILKSTPFMDYKKIKKIINENNVDIF